jgi:purine-binding chemotaxis protein CheW
MSLDSKKEKTQLNEPDQALSGYLEALLGEVEEYREEAPEVAPAVETKAPPEPAVIAPVAEPPAVVELETVSAEPEVAVELPHIPEWGQEPFQCLLFKAGGLTLAVPLVVLNSIAEWEEGLTNLPGQPDWHLGVLKHRGVQVTIMDTVRLIMPERADLTEEVGPPSHILIVGDGRWGLRCEKILKPITLEPEQVRWCHREKRPPWMAGTLPDHLCILLDLEGLLEVVGPSGEKGASMGNLGTNDA